AWTPTADGFATTLVRSGSLVYLAGQFTQVDRVTRRFAAAVDATTGALAAFDPNLGSPADTLAVSADGATVFVGGTFTTVGNGVGRDHIAAFDTAGNVLPFDPDADGRVRTIAVAGSTVYAGGDFRTVAGGTLVRDRLAAFDATTGAATAFDPGMTDSVDTLAVSGTTLYAGGAFSGVGDSTGAPVEREHLAAFDTGSGALLPFDPAPDGAVLALATLHSIVYAAGDFTTVAGTVTRARIAAFDASGTPTDWHPETDEEVSAVAKDAVDAVVGGGRFAFANGSTSRRNLAAFDAATGALRPFAPGLDGAVDALAVSADGATVYAGGTSTSPGLRRA